MEQLKKLGLDNVKYSDSWSPILQKLLEAGYLVCRDGSYLKWSPPETECPDMEALRVSLSKATVKPQ
jgi:hypothetical protein